FTPLDQPLYEYLLASEPPEHAVLHALREETSKMSNARMQIAPEQGHFLAFLTRLICARRILEVGTFTGYSALSMALALPLEGELVTCDVNRDWVNIGLPFWNKAGVEKKIACRIGPARTTLERLCVELPEQFDLAFIDADKDGYDAYYELALQLVRPGGLIILDNTLQRGRVVDMADIESRTISIRELNAKIADDERVDRVILPVGDGM